MKRKRSVKLRAALTTFADITMRPPFVSASLPNVFTTKDLSSILPYKYAPGKRISREPGVCITKKFDDP